MKNSAKSFRGYHRSSKGWYAKHSPDRDISISFGIYEPDGSSDGEMQMDWTEIAGNNTAKLECYDSNFKTLSLFIDVIHELGKVSGEHITEEEFAKLLDKCGFKDMTNYSGPVNGHDGTWEQVNSLSELSFGDKVRGKVWGNVSTVTGNYGQHVTAIAHMDIFNVRGIEIMELPSGKWKKAKTIADIKAGYAVRNIGSNRAFYVTDNYVTRAIAFADADITNPIEWEIFRKHE